MATVMKTTREVKGVGLAIPRADGAEKVTGKTEYVADLKPKGMLHAKLLRSPHAHARIKKIDTSKAKALPGVRAVVTAADIPTLKKKAPTRAHAVLAIDRAVFVGQPIAAVAADEPAIAEEAAQRGQVPHLDRPDERAALGERGIRRPQAGMELELPRRHVGADPEAAPGVALQHAEVGDPGEVDDVGGLEEMVLELGQQVGPAREELGVAPSLGEDGQACIDTVRCCELETSHGSLLGRYCAPRSIVNPLSRSRLGATIA